MSKYTAFVYLLAIASVPAISCKKDNTSSGSDAKGIFYKTAGLNFSYEKSATVGIDINQDDKTDFELFCSSYSTELDTIGGFFIRSLQGNKVQMLELSDNPLFDSMNTMSFAGGEDIVMDLSPEHSWEGGNGVLALKHVADLTSYIGRWSDGASKMLAFILLIEDKPHFGWMRLQYNRQNHSISILDYAFNLTSVKSIKADQKL